MKKTLLFLFISQFALGQSELLIEKFASSGDFYTAFNSGSGSITTNTNTSDFISGTSSLQINYSFNAGNASFFSALKNYATATKDWSLSPQKFSLNYKGGNSNTQIKLRLWEDVNMDGQFNSSDEVFVSSAHVTGNSSWTKIEFNVSAFVLLTGSGNQTLDINRIRAWDIAIENNTSGSLNGTLLFDDLSLQTAYSAPANGNTNLSGSFIQLWNDVGCKCGQFSLQQWKDELQKMKDACLNTVYIQYGVYHDLSWYSPSNLSFVSYKSNTLNKIFEAAESLDMGVYVGVYFDETWNSSNKSSSTTYSTLLSKQQQTIDEIWNLFGSSSAFKGWYLPQEINDLEWQKNPEKSLLFSYLQNVASYARAKNNSKPVMIAPFFNLWQPADVLATWYNDLFVTAPDIKQVFFQDGVGITLKQSDYHLPLYYPALKQVCTNNNVEFGVTAETFQQLTGWPIDGGSFSATSSDINRLKKQLWVAGENQAAQVIQFDWSYMQIQNTSASFKLYNDYKSYSNCLITNSNLPKNSQALFWPNPASNQLNFSQDIVDLKIYSLEGKLILSKEKAQNINTSLCKPGTYFIVLKQNNGQVSSHQLLIHD